jgi:MFS family permease
VFIGPFLGAAAMAWTGTSGGYWVHVLAAALAVAVLVALPAVSESGRLATAVGSGRTVHVIRRHALVLRTLGIGVLLLGAVRASRQVVIPLWAEHIGLDPAMASVIFGVSGAVDMLMFYPAGWVMDRIGRSWAVVPCMTLLGLAHIVLPLAGSAAALTYVAILMGFGNGIGSGIVMTLGSDVSPDTGRAVFLGAWRLCGDLGSGIGPLLISGITVVSALGPAAMAIGVMAGVGAVAMARWVPRHGGPQ